MLHKCNLVSKQQLKLIKTDHFTHNSHYSHYGSSKHINIKLLESVESQLSLCIFVALFKTKLEKRTMHAVLQMSAGVPYPAPINTSSERYCRV